MPVLDADGNEIPGTLTQEEAKALSDKAEQNAKALTERDEELSKLRAKDLNFERFRSKTEAEKKEILEKATTTERMALEELETQRQEREEERKQILEDAKEEALKRYAGEDKDLRQSIENQAKEFSGEVKTAKDLQARIAKAAAIVKSLKPGVNPLNGYSPSTDYSEPHKESKEVIKTDRGREGYKQMFGHYPGELGKKQ